MQSKDGTYQRPSYSFQGRVGSPDFPFEAGRYHLYVGNACPWCHRTLLALVVCGLEGSVRLVVGCGGGWACRVGWPRRSVAMARRRHVCLAACSFSRVLDDPERASRGGWVFEGRDPIFGCRDLRCGGGGKAAMSFCTRNFDLTMGGCSADLDSTFRALGPWSVAAVPAEWYVRPLLITHPSTGLGREVYDMLSPGFTGRCTAPLLVDKQSRRAVCNESALIVRNFAELAQPLGGGGGTQGGRAVDLCPVHLRGDIDAWNQRIYENGAWMPGVAGRLLLLPCCSMCATHSPPRPFGRLCPKVNSCFPPCSFPWLLPTSLPSYSQQRRLQMRLQHQSGGLPAGRSSALRNTG